MGDEFKEIKDEEKEKLDPAEQEQEGHEPTSTNHSGRNNSWIAGVIIIGLGLIFLVRNVTGYELNNWWALFILIPAIVSFATAWNAYREDGGWSKRARGGLVGGAILTFVAIIFLFDLDWGKMWPVFLILAGVSALLGGWFKR